MTTYDRRWFLAAAGTAALGGCGKVITNDEPAADDRPAGTNDTATRTATDRPPGETEEATETEEETGTDETGAEPAAANWPSHRGDAGNTAAVPAGPAIDADDVREAWTYAHGRESPGADVAVVDGTVYLSEGGAVRALDGDDGSTEWLSADVGAAGTPAVDGDAVYVSGEQLTALDARTGSVVWESDVDVERGVGVPTVAHDAVFAVVDDTVHAFDPADGSVRWTTGPDDNDLYSFDRRSVAANDDALFAPGDGRLFSFDPETGEDRWYDDPRFHRLNYWDGVSATGEVVTALHDEEQIAFRHPDTNEELGSSPGVRPAAVDDEVAITVSRDTVYGADVRSGEQLWEFGQKSHAFGEPTIVGDTAYVHAGTGGDPEYDDSLVALDKRSGDVRWTLEAGGGREVGDTVVATGDELYLVGDRIVALREPEDDGGDGEDA